MACGKSGASTVAQSASARGGRSKRSRGGLSLNRTCGGGVDKSKGIKDFENKNAKAQKAARKNENQVKGSNGINRQVLDVQARKRDKEVKQQEKNLTPKQLSEQIHAHIDPATLEQVITLTLFNAPPQIPPSETLLWVQTGELRKLLSMFQVLPGDPQKAGEVLESIVHKRVDKESSMGTKCLAFGSTIMASDIDAAIQECRKAASLRGPPASSFWWNDLFEVTKRQATQG